MAIDRSTVEKIIAGVVGAGIVGVGMAALIESAAESGESFVPSYDNPDSDVETEDDKDYEYENIPSVDEVFEQERIQREMDSMWDGHQADQMWEDYRNGVFQQRDSDSDFQSVKQEFEEKSNQRETKYIYLDFTQNLKSGSRNRNDVYQESIEEQFEKIRLKLALYGRNDITDFGKFVNICLPMIKSTYYVSLPSFERRIEHSETYRGADCIYNMVLRPQKSGLISSVIPKELDVILVGDLVFRKELISFVVKGLDLIDENVEKFGELPIECAAACAITKNDRNLPNYGVEGRNLYKPFLTKDMVLSLCEKVYPIENPENAVEMFEKWKKYVEFRKYFLSVQSRRNEPIEHVSFIKAYAISRQDYRKNEDIYAEHLLDGNRNFKKKDQVLLDEANEESVEFPLVKVEIVRKLAEINKSMAKNGKISNFERELRRFTRVQVALSKNNPGTGDDYEIVDAIYLGERVAFETENIVPECDDIKSFFDNRLLQIERQIDKKYSDIIKESIGVYREKEKDKFEKENIQVIREYIASLDRNLETDIENNTDKTIKKRFDLKIKEIRTKYEEKRKKVNKKYKKNKDVKLEEYEEKYASEMEALDVKETQEIEAIPLRDWYVDRNKMLKENFEKSRILQKTKELEHLCTEKENLLQVELAEIIDEEKKEFVVCNPKFHFKVEFNISKLSFY